MAPQRGFTSFGQTVARASHDLRKLIPSLAPDAHQSIQSQYPTIHPTHSTFAQAGVGLTPALPFSQKVADFHQIGFNRGIPNTNTFQSLLGHTGSTPSSLNGSRYNLGNIANMDSNLAGKATTAFKPDAPSGGDPTGARGLDGTKQWDAQLSRVSSESGVPKEVLQSIMGIETGGQNLAANNAGAIGVMQVVPEYWQSTANQFGGNLSDPYTNIRTAAEILKQNYNKYGSWEKAAAAYFGGDGAFNADGSYTNHADSYGTNITDYVNAFRNNMAALGYGRPSQAEISSGGQASSPAVQKAVQAAMSVQGTPYVWGGSNTAGFDCSGLVAWAYGHQGKHFGRTAQEQYDNTQRIGTQDLQPGDLVFFQFPDDSVREGQGGQINHVAIYIGNGQMLQATSDGGVVKISRMTDDWYSRHIVGFGRVT